MPDKRPKKNGGKDSVALLRNSRQRSCVFQDNEPPKSFSILRRAQHPLEPKRSVHFSKGASRHMKIRDRKSPSQALVLMSVVLVLHNLKTGPKKRFFKTSTMRQQGRVGNGKKSIQAQRKRQSFFLLAFGCLVSTSAIHHEFRGKIICRRFQSLNAHAEQERSELSWTGNRSIVPKPCNGYYSQRRSTNKWRSNSERRRFGSILDSTDPRWYTSSSIAWKTLRGSSIFFWVGQWPTTTSYLTRQRNAMQHWELRTCRWSGRLSTGWKQFYSFVQRILNAKHSLKSRLPAILNHHVRIGRVAGIEVFNSAGTLVIQVFVPLRQPGTSKSWVRMSRRTEQYARQFTPTETEHQNFGAVLSPQSSSCGRPRAQTQSYH